MQVIHMKNTQVWRSVGPRSPAWSTLGQMRAGLQEAAEKVVLRKQHRARIQSWGWRDKVKNYMMQLIICRKKYRQLAKVRHQGPCCVRASRLSRLLMEGEFTLGHQ